MDKGTQRFEQAGKVEDLLTEIFARFWTAFASQDMVDPKVALPQEEVRKRCGTGSGWLAHFGAMRLFIA